MPQWIRLQGIYINTALVTHMTEQRIDQGYDDDTLLISFGEASEIYKMLELPIDDQVERFLTNMNEEAETFE